MSSSVLETTHIQRATLADLPVLFTLYKATTTETYPEHNMDIDRQDFHNRFIELGAVFLAAYVGEQAVGFGKIVLDRPCPHLTCRHPALFENGYVLNAYQGQGIGTKLFEARKSLAKGNGSEGGWLTVWEKNIRAIRFHKKNGFHVVGKTAFLYRSNGIERTDTDLVMAIHY